MEGCNQPFRWGLIGRGRPGVWLEWVLFSVEEMVETHNTANHQEPHDDIDGIHDLLGIFSDLAVNCDFPEEFSANRKVEDSADADGSEKSNECCMGHVLDLVDVFMHCEDDWHPAHKQDQNAQENQAVDRNDVVVQKG